MPLLGGGSRTPKAVIAAFDAASPVRDDIQRRSLVFLVTLELKGRAIFAGTYGPNVFVRLDEAGRARAAAIGATALEAVRWLPAKIAGEYVSLPSALTVAELKTWIAEALAYAETIPLR